MELWVKTSLVDRCLPKVLTLWAALTQRNDETEVRACVLIAQYPRHYGIESLYSWDSDFPVFTSDKPFLHQSIPQTSSRTESSWILFSVNFFFYIKFSWGSSRDGSAGLNQRRPSLSLITFSFFSSLLAEVFIRTPQKIIHPPVSLSPFLHTHRQQPLLSS